MEFVIIVLLVVPALGVFKAGRYVYSAITTKPREARLINGRLVYLT